MVQQKSLTKNGSLYSVMLSNNFEYTFSHINIRLKTRIGKDGWHSYFDIISFKNGKLDYKIYSHDLDINNKWILSGYNRILLENKLRSLSLDKMIPINIINYYNYNKTNRTTIDIKINEDIIDDIECVHICYDMTPIYDIISTRITRFIRGTLNRIWLEKVLDFRRQICAKKIQNIIRYLLYNPDTGIIYNKMRNKYSSYNYSDVFDYNIFNHNDDFNLLIRWLFDWNDVII